MKSDFDPRKAHESGDTLPEQANVYVPPRPLAQISDHRTIDFKAIRISAELDPRQAKTQLRLSVPPRQRRGLPLFIFGSAVVLALFGVVIYMAIARPTRSAMVSTELPAPPPAPEAPAAATVVAPAPVGPTATPEPAVTSAPTEPATALAAPSAPKAPRAKSSAQRAAPHKAKVVREPWLE